MMRWLLAVLLVAVASARAPANDSKCCVELETSGANESSGKKPSKRQIAEWHEDYVSSSLKRTTRGAHFPVYRNLPHLELGDLETVLDHQAAESLYNAAEVVHRYFFESNFGPRFEPPENLQEFLMTRVGQCDRAVQMLRELVGGALASSIQNANLLSDDIDGPLHGHVTASINTERGSILLDPTFGIVLITSETIFSKQTFERSNYRMFRFGVTPDDYEIQPADGTASYYLYMARPRSWIAYGTDTLRVATAPIRVVGLLQIGGLDNSRTDVAGEIKSSFHGFLGSYYSDTISKWEFEAETDKVYRVTFYVTNDPYFTMTKMNISVFDSNGDEKDRREAIVNDGRLTFFSRYNTGRFILRMEVDGRKLEGREIDAVLVEPVANRMH